MPTRFEVKVGKLINRLKGFEAFRNEAATKLMKELAPDLIREQLRSGKNYEGDIIQTGYSAWWGSERLKVGKQIEYVDLNYTGLFYGEIFVEEVDTDEYRFGSDVEYAPDLIARYNAILGLSETSLGVLRALMRERFMPQLRIYLKS